jgi:hypothetical protein
MNDEVFLGDLTTPFQWTLTLKQNLPTECNRRFCMTVKRNADYFYKQYSAFFIMQTALSLRQDSPKRVSQNNVRGSARNWRIHKHFKIVKCCGIFQIALARQDKCFNCFLTRYMHITCSQKMSMTVISQQLNCTPRYQLFVACEGFEMLEFLGIWKIISGFFHGRNVAKHCSDVWIELLNRLLFRRISGLEGLTSFEKCSSCL